MMNDKRCMMNTPIFEDCIFKRISHKFLTCLASISTSISISISTSISTSTSIEDSLGDTAINTSQLGNERVKGYTSIFLFLFMVAR